MLGPQAIYDLTPGVKVFKCLLVLCLLVLSLTSHSQQRFVGSGLGQKTPFEFLQKMQGRWMSTCVPIEKPYAKSYKIDHLRVTLTHLKFKSVIYKDRHCKLERSRVPISYRFALGPSMALKAGDIAFALNLKEDLDPGNIWDLWEKNIVSMEEGKMYFGIQPWVKEGTDRRLTTLDKKYFFFRH